MVKSKLTIGIILLWVLLAAGPVFSADALASQEPFMADIDQLAAFGDRRTGSPGCAAAAKFIKNRFEKLGLESVGRQLFKVPVIRHDGSRLYLPDRGVNIDVHPVLANVVMPQTIQPEGLKGPIIYVGSGELNRFNGKPVKGAIVLMDIDSGKNWHHAASLGAAALIYLDGAATPKRLYEDKLELTPLSFPRFRLDNETAQRIFGSFRSAPEGLVSPSAILHSKSGWEDVVAENIYGLIPGSDPELKEQLIIVEAFYDASTLVPGLGHGADEAVGIATLLNLIRKLKQSAPGRSVLFVATAGHAQTLAGAREMVWSIRSRSKDLRNRQKRLKKTVKQTGSVLDMLTEIDRKGLTAVLATESSEQPQLSANLLEAVSDSIKTEVDGISKELMRLRLESKGEENQDRIRNLVSERRLLRRILWRTDTNDLTTEEKAAIALVLPKAMDDFRRIEKDSKQQERLIRSAKTFRSLAKSMEISAVVSLHLSSHGDGFGAFNYGWLFPLRPRVNRTAIYSTLDTVLKHSAIGNGVPPFTGIPYGPAA
jgi:hypothetical protein